MFEMGITEFNLGDKSATHTESSSNINYGLDVAEDLPNDDRIAWEGFSMHSNNATSKANPVDKDNGKKVNRTNANVDRNLQKTNKDQRNVSFLQLVMSTSLPGQNTMSEHTPRLMFPVKKNPQPQQVGKEIEFKANIVTFKFESVKILYRSDPVNSKWFVTKFFVWIKWILWIKINAVIQIFPKNSI